MVVHSAEQSDLYVKMRSKLNECQIKELDAALDILWKRIHEDIKGIKTHIRNLSGA